MGIAAHARSMDVRFISSLTPDDESTFAPALLKVVAAFLDQFPIAYTLRIETTGAQVFQHTHPSLDVTGKDPSTPSVKVRGGGTV